MEITGTIEVNALRVHSCHGVGGQERLVGNDFEVSLSVECPMSDAMSSDNLDGTVSYADLVDIIKGKMSEPSMLIEHVARRIIDAVTVGFPQITAGRVTVAKLLPPIPGCQLDNAAVTLRWRR